MQQATNKRQQVAKIRQERETQRRLEKEEQMRLEELERERERQKLEEKELHRFIRVLTKNNTTEIESDINNRKINKAKLHTVTKNNIKLCCKNTIKI